MPGRPAFLLAWASPHRPGRLAGRVPPLLWLWEQLAWPARSWPCSQRGPLPGEPALTTTGSWLLPQRQRPVRGQAEAAVLEWEPRGLAGKQPSWAGGRWPLEGGRARACVYVRWEDVCKYVRVCMCVSRQNMNSC